MSNKKNDSFDNTLGTRLKAYRLSLKLSQDAFAEKLSISGSHISAVEREMSALSGAVISEIVSAYRVNREWLESGAGPMLMEQAETSNVRTGPPIRGRVPLISWVQAGEWTEVVDSCNLSAAEDWITTTATVGLNAFALRVVGNSMEPEFREGEIVTVDPDREAESGSYVIAKINHDEATFKQLIKDGGSVYLRPINDAYPLMDVTGLDLRIVGRVVEKVKRY